MRTIMCLFVLLLVCPYRASATPLFLFSGQSNMYGSGAKTAELEASQLTLPGNAKYAYFGSYDRPPDSSSYFGPELSFIHEHSAANPAQVFHAGKMAIPGVSISFWDRGNTGHTHVMRSVEDMLNVDSSLSAEAFFWIQGERDAKDEELANNYQHNLTQFVANYRADLGAPDLKFFIGRINSYRADFAWTDTVRAGQEAVASSDPNVYLVDLDGLSKTWDNLHYDTAGTWKAGQRFYDAYAQAIATPLPAGVWLLAAGLGGLGLLKRRSR